MIEDTKTLYNNQATEWNRNEPILLSDYSARPFVIDLCEPIEHKSILDAGCGEGYVGRQLIKRGARQVDGMDISEKMIEQAELQKRTSELFNVNYAVGDIRTRRIDEKSDYDIVLAMFLFNYLNVEDTSQVMEKIYRVLNSNGYFIFSVPHPSLAFLKKDKFPFYFETKGGYFSGRNKLFPGEIWRRDRVAVGVQCIHKTIEDYFVCLKKAGFKKLPEIYELKITKQQVELDPEFFTPLIDLPLHLAIKVYK